MNKQDYNIRMAYLGLTGRDVAAAIDCSPAKLSDAMSVGARQASQVTVNNKADNYLMSEINAKRDAMIRELRDEGLHGEIKVVLPADNLHVVLVDGEFLGFYAPGSRKLYRPK